MATTTITDSVLEATVLRLIEAYQPERIYLFGSRARGDDDADSDLDLVVIVPDDAVPGRRRARRAYEVLWDLGVAADVLVWSHSAFESRRHLRASLPGTVLREGKLLYASGPGAA